jgi:hypothetical protein
MPLRASTFSEVSLENVVKLEFSQKEEKTLD